MKIFKKIVKFYKYIKIRIFIFFVKLIIIANSFKENEFLFIIIIIITFYLNAYIIFKSFFFSHRNISQLIT